MHIFQIWLRKWYDDITYWKHKHGVVGHRLDGQQLEHKWQAVSERQEHGLIFSKY